MELREISTFIQIAQHRSFSKAARQLGYSQAAVTIQIKQLENELGVHLFDRLGKQISLTHQGQVFYEHAIALMRDADAARDAVADADAPNGDLCIGTIESICTTILPDLAAEYHRRYPDVRLRIITDSPEELLNRMNENEIDIVYLLDKRLYDPRWHKTLEIPEENVFVTTRDHPLAQHEGELTIDDILRYPFLLTEKDASYRYILDQYLAACDRYIHPFLEIGSTAFIVQMLHRTSGVTFLPRFTVQHELEEGSLVALPVSRFYMQTWRQVFYHKDKWVSREMQAFLALAGEELTGAESQSANCGASSGPDCTQNRGHSCCHSSYVCDGSCAKMDQMGES